jgi:hypothetical protein
MADNVAITAGTGTTIASDDIAGVQYQRVKATLGADGTAVDPIAISAALDSTGAGVPAVGILAQYDDTSTAAVTENRFAAPRITSTRELMTSDDDVLAAIQNSTLPVGYGAASTAGRIVPATVGFSAAVSVTRTSDTNAYAANDVLGAATGSTAALTFASMGPAAGEIVITSASFQRNVSAIISGETSYVLHLYNVTPPSALGDNTAFDLPSGDRASYLGSISLGSPVDLGSTLYVATDGINKQITLASSSLYGYLVTVGAYTPTSAAVHVVTLHAVAV